MNPLWLHRRLSKLRPREGDVVSNCGHKHAAYFFFDGRDPINHLRWLALCRECFVRFGHCPEDAIRTEVEAA